MVLQEFWKVNKIIFGDQFGMKEGDTMLIITAPITLDVAEATQEHAMSMGVKAPIITPPPQLLYGLGEYCKAVQAVLPEINFIYSIAGNRGGWWLLAKEALAHGVKVLGVGSGLGIDDSLVRTMVRVDAYKLKEEASRIGEAFTEADTLRITSREGTDYTEDISGKVGTPGFVWADDPKGQPYEFLPLATPGIDRQPPIGTGNGTIVFDAFIDMFGILREPVKLTVVNDEIKKIEGGLEADRFRAYLSKFPEKYLAEIQIGINPNATLMDSVRGGREQYERVRGALHIGMGDLMPYPVYDGEKLINPDWKPAIHHCDGLMLKPTVYLDDKIVVKDGVIQKPYAIL